MSNTASEKSKGVFKYKSLILIFVLAVIWQVFNSTIPKEEGEYDVFEILLTLSYLVTALISFFVAKRYWSSGIFGKTYLSLGLAYLMYFLGDVVFFYQENVLKIDPYPSPADIFYFAFYPFSMYHLLKNSLYFKRKFEMKTKIWLSALPAVMIISYFLFSFYGGEIDNFDFSYGLIFVACNAVVMVFTILGAQVFRQSILGPVWGLIVLGILFYTVADAWYYHLEIFNQYTETHIVNMLWLLNTMVVTYALYKHQKVI